MFVLSGSPASLTLFGCGVNAKNQYDLSPRLSASGGDLLALLFFVIVFGKIRNKIPSLLVRYVCRRQALAETLPFC